MKPTSPDERDPQDIDPALSDRYRAGSREEPSARIDALIAEAARREVQSPARPGANWRMPASIAAVLVIGVSLVLLVQDNEPPYPSLDQFSQEGSLARPQAPGLPPEQPKAKSDLHREDRPTRERTARPDRRAGVHDETAPIASGEVGQSPVPAEAAAPSSAATDTDEQTAAPAARREFATQGSANMKDEAQSPSRENGQAAERLLEKKAEALPQPRDWLLKIDGLLRAGKQEEARSQLLNFRRQYPHYPLPERLEALLPTQRRGQ